MAHLYLLTAEELHQVDAQTGEIAWTVAIEAGLSSLAASDGLLVAGSLSQLVFLDPASGTRVRTVALNYGVRSVAADDESLYMMELPVFDYDKANQRVRVWPKETMIHRLTFDGDNPDTEVIRN